MAGDSKILPCGQVGHILADDYFLRFILIPLFLCEIFFDCKYFCGVDLWVLKMQYYLEMCAYIEDVYSLEFHVR